MNPSQPRSRGRRSPLRPPRRKYVPQVRAALAVSLDGFIADVDGGVAWLNPFFSPELDFAGFMKTIGAIVMGRKTYDDAMKLGGLGGFETLAVVLTHRVLRKPPPGVQAFSGDIDRLLARLRRELAASGQDIWLMGGGVAIDAFRAAGLVDRLELSVIPVLLGQGIPLFPPQSRGPEDLRLVHSRMLTNGIAEVWYEPRQVKRRAAGEPR